MALDPISNLLFSALELAKGGILFSIPAFVIVWISTAIQGKLKLKYSLNWVKSAFLTAYIVTFAIVIFIYYLPIFGIIGASPLGVIPEEFRNSLLEVSLQQLFNLGRLLIVSLVLTFILIPLAFIGSFLRAEIGKKFKLPSFATLYLTILVITLLVSGIVLFIFPWAITGIFTLIFFGLQG